MTRQARRITRELTPDEKARLEKSRTAVADELSELVAQGQLLKDAAEEKTFSGALRRAIHASDLSIDQVAEKAGISMLVLGEFLTGERTLRSDVIDRLAIVLECNLTQKKQPVH